jgi:hypothetical protein
MAGIGRTDGVLGILRREANTPRLFRWEVAWVFVMVCRPLVPHTYHQGSAAGYVLQR